LSAGDAYSLERFDRNQRRREKLFKANPALSTDLAGPRQTIAGGRLVGFLNYELEPAFQRHDKKVDPGYEWEGPKSSFTSLIGVNDRWDGPASQRVEVLDLDGKPAGSVCVFCGSPARLPPSACCIGCDRTGRDDKIPVGKPRTEPKSYKRRGLKGGRA
jgi:hypothetical protein